MRNRKLVLLTAAAVTVGGLAGNFAARAQQAPAQPAQGAAASGSSAAGDKSSSSSASINNDSARQPLVAVADAVINGKLSDLSQQLSQADRDRLKNLDQSQQQLSQTIDQLKAAYKAKYNQDLNIRGNEQQIFTVAFFHVGGAEAAGAAQPAGARVGGTDSSASSSTGAAGTSATGTGASGASGTGTSGASGTGTSGAAATGTSGAAGTGTSSGTTSSGTSGTSGVSGAAGTSSGTSGTSASGTTGIGGTSGTSSGGTAGTAASTTGDVAQPAAARSGASSSASNMVTIEASHGLPAVQIPLTQENGSARIDIPDSVDAQKLTQNLQTQLSQCVQQKDQWPADANDAAREISHSVFVAIMDAGSQDSSKSGAAAPSGTGASPSASPPSGTTGSPAPTQ